MRRPESSVILPATEYFESKFQIQIQINPGVNRRSFINLERTMVTSLFTFYSTLILSDLSQLPDDTLAASPRLHLGVELSVNFLSPC